MVYNPETLIVVHCYEGDAGLLQNFLPVFEHHERPVLALSPEDSKVAIPGISNASAGEKGWKGPQTIHRQLAHWKLALGHESNSQWFLLNDADSMCLDPQIPQFLYEDLSILWANVLCHENEHLETDCPNLNPPYFMHRGVLENLVGVAEEIRDDIPQDAFLEPHDWGQAIDGFYTHLALDLLKQPYANYPCGITTWPRGRPDLFKFASQGACMVHGVKNVPDLTLLLTNYRMWQMAQNIGSNVGYFNGDTITVTETL